MEEHGTMMERETLTCERASYGGVTEETLQLTMTRRALFGTTALLALGALGLAGCSSLDGGGSSDTGSSIGAPNAGSAGEEAPEASGPSGTRAAVVYFSQPETTKTSGLTEEEENSVVVVDGQALGNTQYVAQLIAEQTGADLIRLEPDEPYTTDHEELVDLAREEQRADARPELSQMPDLSAYDLVFFGYPIWWSDLPQICYTFLEGVDLSGKTVALFNTHGGSGDAGTPERVIELVPGATVLDNNLVLSRNEMDACADEVRAWAAHALDA